MADPTIICMTPVKNEAWILERFLRCASLWADIIIVADQGSDDGSREIAQRFPKVRLIENPSETFNEPERQKLLIDEARTVPGPRVLIALDADEFLSANFFESCEWQRALAAQPGTVITFQWGIVWPDLKSYYLYPAEFPLGFVDDGSEHVGRKIHSPRVPEPPDAPRLRMEEIRVLHFSVADFDRFRSKVRWYQCWELLNQPDRRSYADLYRFYHRDFAVPAERIVPIPQEWVAGYQERGIDLLDLAGEDYYRWDEALLELLEEHGPARFRRLAIWDVDWSTMYERIKGRPNRELRDPRTALERAVHWWLARSQKHYSHYSPPRTRLSSFYLRGMRKTLRALGW